MPNITKALTLAIAKKLGARIDKRRKSHDIAIVEHDGKIIAQFGIRRGSRKDLGHDHVPEQIFVRPNEARLLGQCPLSRKEWIKIISEKGKL